MSLDGGIEALKIFRDASPFFSEIWAEDAAFGGVAVGSNPSEWPGVKSKDGRVTHLKLEGTAKTPASLGDEGLPTEIGALVGLTTIEMMNVRQLITLPPTVGQLSKLMTLMLRGCSDLTSLPPEIGQCAKLEMIDLQSASRLTALPPEIGQLQNLRAIKIANCICLEALPPEIGKLTGLKTLRAEGCVKLKELPLDFGMLTVLTSLNVEKCRALLLPEDLKKDNVPAEDIVGYLAAQLIVSERESFAQPVTVWLHKRPKAVAHFVTTIVTDASKAPGVAKAVAACPSLTEVAVKGGPKAIEAACAECRAAMENALFFLGRYEVDAAMPLHLSASSAVLCASDNQEAKGGASRRVLKLLRDESTLLTELKGRQQLENGILLPILQVHACSSAPTGEDSFENLYDGKIPISRHDELSARLEELMTSRCNIGGGAHSRLCAGYKYVMVMRLADATLSASAPMISTSVGGIRKTAVDLAKTIDRLHTQKKSIHAALEPRHVRFSQPRSNAIHPLQTCFRRHALRLSDPSPQLHCASSLGYSQLIDLMALVLSTAQVVLVGNAWQLIDMGVSMRIDRAFGQGNMAICKGPNLAYCPPEMAKVVLRATDARSGQVKLTELKSYGRASIAYDLWSFGCILYQLVYDAPMWRAKQDGSFADPKDLERLAAWSTLEVDELLASAASGGSTAGTTTERLAAADLIRKLLEPEEAARLEHFSASAGNELRAVMKHPFLTGDAEGATKASASADMAAKAAAAAKVEKQRVAEETAAANKADKAELLKLKEEMTQKRQELKAETAKVSELESGAAALSKQLAASQAQLAATQGPMQRMSGLEQRDSVLRADRERVQGVLKAALDAAAVDAEGLFGAAAKERMAVLQAALDGFSAELPNVSEADAITPEAAAAAAAAATAAEGAAAPSAPPKAASPAKGTQAEERHLNELMENLEAKEALVSSLEGKEKAAEKAIKAKDARVAELEAQVAALKTSSNRATPEPDGGGDASFREKKKPKKLKKAEALTIAEPSSSPKDAPEPSVRNSTRGKKMSMKDRMSAFQK